jgi:ankyrin repeat protein
MTDTSLMGCQEREAVVKLLLDKHADVESKDESGWTPLSWATKKGHVAVVKLLFDENFVDVESKDKSGRIPLSYREEPWGGAETAARQECRHRVY